MANNACDPHLFLLGLKLCLKQNFLNIKIPKKQKFTAAERYIFYLIL